MPNDSLFGILEGADHNQMAGIAQKLKLRAGTKTGKTKILKAVKVATRDLLFPVEFAPNDDDGECKTSLGGSESGKVKLEDVSEDEVYETLLGNETAELSRMSRTWENHPSHFPSRQSSTV